MLAVPVVVPQPQVPQPPVPLVMLAVPVVVPQPPVPQPPVPQPLMVRLHWQVVRAPHSKPLCSREEK